MSRGAKLRALGHTTKDIVRDAVPVTHLGGMPLVILGDEATICRLVLTVAFDAYSRSVVGRSIDCAPI